MTPEELELFKANVAALTALNGRLSKMEASVASLSKEMPPKDGTKQGKDTDHNATTPEQETQVHEATPEAAVGTFKPENTKEGAFAPTVKAAPAKTISFDEAVRKAVAAELSKQRPAVSATPAPPAVGFGPSTPSTGYPGIDLINKCIDNDRKLHGIHTKNTENPDAPTGFRPGETGVYTASARFMRKALAQG